MQSIGYPKGTYWAMKCDRMSMRIRWIRETKCGLQLMASIVRFHRFGWFQSVAKEGNTLWILDSWSLWMKPSINRNAFWTRKNCYSTAELLRHLNGLTVGRFRDSTLSMLTLVALNYYIHEMKINQEQSVRACIHSNTTFTRAWICSLSFCDPHCPSI